MDKKMKTDMEVLVKIAMWSSKVYEEMMAEEQIRESLEEYEPIKNKDGNYEFLLMTNPDPGYALFLVITPTEVYLDCQDDYKFAQAPLKDCFAKKWFMEHYKF